MKPMKNFAAQQLTKKQMNEVKGGAYFNCSVSINGAPAISGQVRANSSDHAACELALIYLDMGKVDITCS